MRNGLALGSLALFLVPAALFAYVTVFEGDVEGLVYSIVQALRGVSGDGLDALLVDAGRFLVAWWWLLALLAYMASHVGATALAAMDTQAPVRTRMLWVLSFWLTSVTVPVYCAWCVDVPSVRNA